VSGLEPALGVDVVQSRVVPKGTFLLVPRVDPQLGLTSFGIVFRRDPWPRPPLSLSPHAIGERQRALDFLADLLDQTWLELGLDPETWRAEREREDRSDYLRFAAEERIALSVINPATVGRVITP
jgi:hypothetical protein